MTDGLNNIQNKEKKLAAIMKLLKAQSALNQETMDILNKHQKTAQDLTARITKNMAGILRNEAKMAYRATALVYAGKEVAHKQKQVRAMQTKMNERLGETSELATGSEHEQVTMDSLQDSMDRMLTATTALGGGLEKVTFKMTKHAEQMAENSQSLNASAHKMEVRTKTMRTNAAKLEHVIKENVEQDKAVEQNVKKLQEHGAAIVTVAQHQFETATTKSKKSLEAIDKKIKSGKGDSAHLKAEQKRIQDHLDKSKSNYDKATYLNTHLMMRQKGLTEESTHLQNTTAQVQNKSAASNVTIDRLAEENEDMEAWMGHVLLIAAVFVISLGFACFHMLTRFRKQLEDLKAQQAQSFAAEYWDEQYMETDANGEQVDASEQPM